MAKVLAVLLTAQVSPLMASHPVFCSLLFRTSIGLIVLPNFLHVAEQKHLITSALQETTGPASRTNLDSHYHPPSSGWWRQFVQEPQEIVQTRAAGQTLPEDFRPTTQRVQVDLKPMDTSAYKQDQTTLKEDPVPSTTVRPLATQDLIRKLRWTIIGLEYHVRCIYLNNAPLLLTYSRQQWGTKSYKWDKPPMPMPDIFRETCQKIAHSVPWSEIPLSKNEPLDTSGWQNYKPEAGVVNFYQFRDSLTAHIDQSEVDSVRPLISISLGESCIFLAGGLTRDQRPIPFLLRSGDVVIMAGEGRRVFHGVPRIIEDGCQTAFDWSNHTDGDRITKFLRGTRININVRQVFSESDKDHDEHTGR